MLRWLYAQPLMCVHLPVSVWLCVCVYIDSAPCVFLLYSYVELCTYTMCSQPHVSPIVLSGSDRVSTTVWEKGDSREEIAALQLSSQWWLLSGDYTATFLSTWKDMNGTTTTELTNTAWKLESDTTWRTFLFIKAKIDYYILNRLHSPTSALMSQ